MSASQSRRRQLEKQRVGQFYSLSQILYRKGLVFLPKLIRFVIRVLYSADLPYQADIARGVHFSHNGLGVVIHPRATVGEGTVINQHVTIGGRAGIEAVPRVGKNVLIGAGAKILGDVEIGDGAKIGVNAVVIKSVPSNAVVYGPLGTIVAPGT